MKTEKHLFATHFKRVERRADWWHDGGRLPRHVTVDDARQTALEALWRAATSFDSERCDSFAPYAYLRVDCALRGLWRSGCGRLLGGLNSKRDNLQVRVEPLEPLEPFGAAVAHEGDSLLELRAYREAISLLSASGRSLVERALLREVPKREQHAAASVRANLKAAVRSGLSEGERERRLRCADRAGSGCLLLGRFAAVDGVEARRAAVRDAAARYSQQRLAFLFGLGRSTVCGYVNGDGVPTGELAGVCSALADGRLSMDDAFTGAWRI